MSDLKSIGEKIAGAAPVIAAALGGPAAGAVAALVVDKLGLESAEGIASAPESVLKDADRNLAHDIAMAQIKSNHEITLAQIGVNKEAAKSKTLFVAGARPSIIWVGAFGLGYHFIAAPILNGIVAALGGPVAAFPDIDIGPLAALVVTLLGGSALRSYEKKHGVARESL